MVLRGSDHRRAKLRVRGKGGRLGDLPLPLAAPLTVQLVNLETGTCWGNEFGAADIKRSTEIRLRAKTTS
jgi:hypothetical protein